MLQIAWNNQEVNSLEKNWDKNRFNWLFCRFLITKAKISTRYTFSITKSTKNFWMKS